MTTFLIWYSTDKYPREYGYATVDANNEKSALQNAIQWIPNLREVKISGEINRRIRGF